MTNTDDEAVTPEVRFGRAVRAAREDFGWTQAELAAHMSTLYAEGYSHSTVAKTEAGSRPVRLNEASALATILRRDLALMVRAPGPRNELTRQLSTIRAKIRDVERESSGLRTARAELEAQAEEVRIRLEHLEQREGERGVDREEA